MSASLIAVALGLGLSSPLERVPPRLSTSPYTAALIVPTGIGASIGGFAGDALPVARAFTGVCDRLVTHPNVMNGAMLSHSDPRLLYTEGYALDELAAGRWGLRPVTSQRIGLLLDSAIEPELRMRHLQAADACRATLGVNVAAHTTTDAPLGVELRMSPAGASYGSLANPESLLKAAERLADAGCTAIAVVARFPDDEDEEMLAEYRAGSGVDAIGGVEAIISHLVTKRLKLPCAHAPALEVLELDEELSPRNCAEELGYTFLPCILSNLATAPSLLDGTERPLPGDLWADDLDAIVVPAGACGGPAVMALLGGGGGGGGGDNADDDGERSRHHSNSIGRTTSALVIAVEENQCALDVSPDALRAEGIVLVRSYAEALGVLAAHKAGVNPACLTPNVASIRELEVVDAEEASSSHSSAPPLPIREILAPPKTQRSPAVIAMAGDGTEGRTGGGGSILQKLAATDESDGLIEKVDAFEQEQGDDAAPGATYDDIRATIAASRARSYEQGRKGCCGKAADYLGSKGPPPGSPWARDA